MYSNGYSSSPLSSRYYTVSSSSGYPGSRFDDGLSDQMDHLPSRHGRGERSYRARNQSIHSGTYEGRSTVASSSRQGSSRQTTYSSGYGPSYISSQDSMDRGRSRTGASTRASTVYPGDSISNTGRRPRRQHNDETRGRSVAPVGHRSQRVTEVYPSTFPSTSSYQSSRSTRSSHVFDSGPTYSYVMPPRSRRATEVASDVTSSSVTHPFAYDDSGRTHTWHPPSRYQNYEAGRRSRRSDAPSSESRAYYGQAGARAYRSVASSPTRSPPRSAYGYPPPPPTPVLRGRSGGNFSSVCSAMEDAAYDSDVEHPFS